MKNKKGFTMVELLAVILLVAVLLLIAVPAIMKYMKKGTNSYYRSIENEMRVAGMDYMESYRTLLPRQIDHVTVVELDELVDNKYIDPVVDEKGNSCTGQVAVKKLKNNNFEYHSCLKCNEYYSSEQQECDYDESKNEYADSSLYTVNAPDELYRVKQFETFNAPFAEVYYNGQLIKTDLEGKPKKLDTTKVGTYEIKYYYHGASDSITVEVYDGTEPSQTQVVLKYENKNGKNYKENWYSGNIYAEYKATDYSKKGIEGSGIDHYETSTDQVTWTRIDGNSELIKLEGIYTRYVRAVDKAGIPGKANSYMIKIDKTPPTGCTWEGESTDWQPKVSQYPNATDRANFSRTIKATCHDALSGCTNATKTHSWKETGSNKTKTLTYDMYDLAGNKTVCSKAANIYIDKIAPNISAVSNPISIRTNGYAFTNNISVNDKYNGVELSGIKSGSLSCSPSSSTLSAGTETPSCTVKDNMGLSSSTSFTAKYCYAATYHYDANASHCGTEDCCLHEEWQSYCAPGEDCSCYVDSSMSSSACYGSCNDNPHCCTYCGGGHTIEGWVCTQHGQCAKTCTYYTCDHGGHLEGSTCWY